jgi:predicted GH43/DUF377 family glycosyl hydrolase
MIKVTGIIFLSLAISVSANTGFGELPSKKTGNFKNNPPELVLVKSHPKPVITNRMREAGSNKFGFEGGRVIKINNVYHLFTSEMTADPCWVKMKLGYWQSKDKLNWQRISTIRESSGNFNGQDTRAALWSPLPVFDEKENRWNLFYVAYRSAPNEPERFLLNHDGKIYRAVSAKRGKDGIGGPYTDVGIVMQPDAESQPWEGLQGVDSFFPYKVGNKWYAFYGSAKTEEKPIKLWTAGLASAPALGGPWKRMPQGNPTNIEDVFFENAIVHPLKTGGYMLVYDAASSEDAIGYSYSEDGVNWQKGKHLTIQSKKGEWSKDVRTPLGLVEEGNNRFTIFYTGFEQDPEWDAFLAGKVVKTCAIGYAEVELRP